MGAIGDAISQGINTVEHLGAAAGEALTGNFGGALSDVGKAATSGVGALVNGFMATNPELGLVSSLAGSLGGILGQAGGFNVGQAGGSPSPFGIGNLLPGVLQNPLGSLGGLLGNLGGLFGGGGSGGGSGFPGIGGGSGGGGGSAGGGGDLGDLSSRLQGNLALQKQVDAIEEAAARAAAIESAAHSTSMNILSKIS